MKINQQPSSIFVLMEVMLLTDVTRGFFFLHDLNHGFITDSFAPKAKNPLVPKVPLQATCTCSSSPITSVSARKFYLRANVAPEDVFRGQFFRKLAKR